MIWYDLEFTVTQTSLRGPLLSARSGGLRICDFPKSLEHVASASASDVSSTTVVILTSLNSGYAALGSGVEDGTALTTRMSGAGRPLKAYSMKKEGNEPFWGSYRLAQVSCKMRRLRILEYGLHTRGNNIIKGSPEPCASAFCSTVNFTASSCS